MAWQRGVRILAVLDALKKVSMFPETGGASATRDPSTTDKRSLLERLGLRKPAQTPGPSAPTTSPAALEPLYGYRRAPGQDPVAHVLTCLQGRNQADQVVDLLQKAGTSVRIEPLARSLYASYRLLNGLNAVPPAQRTTLMVHLLHDLRSKGRLDEPQFQSGMKAAERVARFLELTDPAIADEHDVAFGDELRAASRVRSLAVAAIDCDSLLRRLDDPATWLELLVLDAEDRHCTDESYEKVHQAALALADRMERFGFVPPAVAERLRARVPQLVRACKNDNRLRFPRTDGQPDPVRTEQLTITREAVLAKAGPDPVLRKQLIKEMERIFIRHDHSGDLGGLRALYGWELLSMFSDRNESLRLLSQLRALAAAPRPAGS